MIKLHFLRVQSDELSIATRTEIIIGWDPENCWVVRGKYEGRDVTEQ
jgi:hypothetical protein